MLFIIYKTPCGDLDYGVDWSAWLGDDTAVTSTVTVPAGSGITIYNDQLIDGIATFWVKGGTIGGVYEITNTITTAAARVDCRKIRVEIVTKP
jgi:hypothetical protein